MSVDEAAFLFYNERKNSGRNITYALLSQM